jgi:8-oxo-dGTP pyrophosphatase MutT (NUDIX family)
MKLYKIRAFLFLYVSRILSKILFVDIPPIVSVTAIIKRDSKVLFIDLTYLKGFGLPGGLVKQNEEIEDAVRREVKEETDLDITNLKYLWSTPYILKVFQQYLLCLK